MGDDQASGGIDSACAMVKKHKVEDTPVEFLNSCSALINLAGSGKALDGGWARGRIINFVGDGSSGKTLLALELAAMCIHKMLGNVSKNFPKVKRVRVRYNNGEGVMDFPINTMYGEGFSDSIEWVHSETVEDFGRDFTREVLNHKEGELLLYIVDSLDSLASQAGRERFEKAAKADKEEDGSYGTEKAKYLSQSFFDNISSMMRGKDITLVIISQIREKLGITFGKKYGRTGGKSLDFYTHQVVWLYEQEKLKRTFRGEDRVYGIRVLAKFERNKTAKPFREAEFYVLFDYGLDDITTNLAYLYGPKVKLLEWDGVEYKRDELIKHIEQNNLQDVLALRVEEQWNQIEEHMKPDRIGKYV
jgi:RecA/RadA recombinase